VRSFGTPTWSNQNDVAFSGYDWVGGVTYTVVLPCINPVRSLVVSAPAGIDWDMRGELSICRSFLPLPASYIRGSAGSMFYVTRLGEVGMTPATNQCSLIFVEGL
jgi:hypothetical protein